MALPEIDGKSDDGADEGAKLENGPKDTEGFAFIPLERVTHHNAPLSGPKQSSGDTQDRAGEYQEPSRALGLVADEDEELGLEALLRGQITHAQRAPT